MNRLWDFVFDKLYCEKTGLIYENITEYSQGGNIRNLPTISAYWVNEKNNKGE